MAEVAQKPSLSLVRRFNAAPETLWRAWTDPQALKQWANRKLVFTWAWKTTPERESLVTLQLRPVDDGTELTLTHEQFYDAAARDRHHEGWVGCLGSLERLLG